MRAAVAPDSDRLPEIVLTPREPRQIGLGRRPGNRRDRPSVGGVERVAIQAPPVEHAAVIGDGDHFEQLLLEYLASARDAFAALPPLILELGAAHDRAGGVEIGAELLHCFTLFFHKLIQISASLYLSLSDNNCFAPTNRENGQNRTPSEAIVPASFPHPLGFRSPSKGRDSPSEGALHQARRSCPRCYKPRLPDFAVTTRCAHALFCVSDGLLWCAPRLTGSALRLVLALFTRSFSSVRPPLLFAQRTQQASRVR